MEPRIEFLSQTRVVGLRRTMSLAEDRTPELWRAFMPRRREIEGRVGTDLLSIRIHDPSANHPNSPHAPFERWAAVEVEGAGVVPDGMEALTLPEGRYAVFLHQGPASAAPRTWGIIFGEWFPRSTYRLDDRPHVERLPEGYRPDDPNAREEVWIPIR